MSFLSKTLKRIVAFQIDEYLHDNCHNAKMQLVSRKCHSPETALICFVNDIQRAIDGQCESILVLLDLFAAFDTIDHAILLERLLSTTERLIHGFVSLKLDYCNSILHGLPSYELEKLQRLQNTAAKLTVRAKKSVWLITLILKSLHCLPSKERINFKILLATYKILLGFAPTCLN